MPKSQLNLQDVFLNQVRKENIGVTIFLVNSVQLRGHVRGFDPFTVLLEIPGRPTQLVYKHAITSIVPSRPVSGFYGEGHRGAQPVAAPRPVEEPVAPPAEPVEDEE
jgi:host factor-I protein